MQSPEEENFVLMKAFSLVIASDWLSLRTLARLSAVNHEMDTIASESSIWQLYLTRKSILQLGQDHDGCDLDSYRECWKAPHIPPLWTVQRLRIPSRIHGRRYDAFSYESHEDDTAVKGRKLVLPSRRDSQNLLIVPQIQPMRFNEDTGELEDLFHVRESMQKTFVVPHPLDILLPPDAFVGPLHGGAAGGFGAIQKFRVVPKRAPIWVKRELPIYCPISDKWFHSYKQLVDHCVLFEHQKEMVTLEIRQDVPNWDEMSPKAQVRAYLANNDKMNMFDLYDRRCCDLHTNMFQMYKYWLVILLVIFITPLERMFASYYDIQDLNEALLATTTMSHVFTFLFIIMPILRWCKINITKSRMQKLKYKIAHIVHRSRSEYSKVPQFDVVG